MTHETTTTKHTSWKRFDPTEGFKIRDRYNSEGLDILGYDREGFKNGWSFKGINKETRNKFDTEGYDREGFGRDGYNREGFDRYGYDREEFGRDGYSSAGFNRDGYNRAGFDRDGYNRVGVSRYGFHRDGWYLGLTKYDEQG